MHACMHSWLQAFAIKRTNPHLHLPVKHFFRQVGDLLLEGGGEAAALGDCQTGRLHLLDQLPLLQVLEIPLAHSGAVVSFGLLQCPQHTHNFVLDLGGVCMMKTSQNRL